MTVNTSAEVLHAALEKFGHRIHTEQLGRYSVGQLTGLGEYPARRLIALVRQHAKAGLLKENPDAPKAETEKISLEESGDNLTVDYPKGRIDTVEALLERANIDLRYWEVERTTLNTWDMGSTPRRTGNDKEGWQRPSNDPQVTQLFAIKIWLKRRKDVLAIEAIKREALEEIRLHSPVPLLLPSLRRSPQPQQLLYMGAHDIHVGKFADVSETGQKYNMELAADLARRSVARLLAEASPYGIDRILLPVGHDLAHVDGNGNMTTGGTPQDTDGRYRLMRRHAYELMVSMIEDLRQVAPVDVEAVPGNHGRETDLAIAERLEARFHNDPHVSVRASLTPRPYYRYGVNLLGLTHGDRIKGKDLPLIMAEEVPQAWAETTDREWLLGHFHKKQTLQMMTSEDEYRGVRVRHLPSISALDWYHAVSGYANMRSMEAYRYDLVSGYSGHHSVNVRSLELGRPA